MKKVVNLLLLAALIAVGILMWRHFFPNEEKRVRKMLSSLAEDISDSKKKSLITNAVAVDSIASYFTPDAEIDGDIPEFGHISISGRPEIVNAAIGARALGARVEFGDIAIKIEPGKETATVELTVKVIVPGQREIEMQDARLSLKKYDGDWRIAKAETVRAFK